MSCNVSIAKYSIVGRGKWKFYCESIVKLSWGKSAEESPPWFEEARHSNTSFDSWNMGMKTYLTALKAPHNVTWKQNWIIFMPLTVGNCHIYQQRTHCSFSLWRSCESLFLNIPTSPERLDLQRSSDLRGRIFPGSSTQKELSKTIISMLFDL